MPRPVLRRSLAAAACALALAACEKATPSPAEPKIEATTFASALGVNLAASTKTASGLYYRDITVGAGAVVAKGSRVTVHYVGNLSSGRQFDANVSGAAPLGFTVGAGEVIDGWEEGVVGMRVGGRRQLIVPPSLGYGANDYGPIPGNSILVFTIDLLSAQ